MTTELSLVLGVVLFWALCVGGRAYVEEAGILDALVWGSVLFFTCALSVLCCFLLAYGLTGVDQP